MRKMSSSSSLSLLSMILSLSLFVFFLLCPSLGSSLNTLSLDNALTSSSSIESSSLSRILISSIPSHKQCIGSIPFSQYIALQSFHQSTNGMYWNCSYLTNPILWVFPNNDNNSELINLSLPCTEHWMGLNCSINYDYYNNSSCVISTIQLHSCNLSGTLPSQLNALLDLIEFDVRENQIHGTIPSQLGSLVNLTWMDVSYNQFIHTIPSSLGNLTALQYLNIYGNSFTGHVPTELGYLSRLEYLGIGASSVRHRHLTGHFPYQLYNLTSLEYLSFTNTLVTGYLPSSIMQLTRCKAFFLVGNRISGLIPSEIGNMPAIEYLMLNSNYFTGAIPKNLPLTLQANYLYNNYMTGKIPSTLFQSNIVELLVYGNSYSGVIPSTINTASQLVLLNMMGNWLTGSLPVMDHCYKLVFSVFNDNYLSQSLPTALLGLNNLQVFQISNNYVTGTLPSEYGLVPQLFELFLSSNYLTGSLPSQLSILTNLNEIELAGNYFSGVLPIEWRNITSLQALNVSKNLLTGNIIDLFRNQNYVPGFNAFPSIHFNSLVSLLSIDLSFNSFTNSIPNELFDLPQIQTISLSTNCFEGTISNSVCNSNNLQVLAFDALSSSDACQVKVPPGLSGLIKATFFNGFIKGTIPSCIFTLHNLTTLHLSGNGLTGTISDILMDSSMVDLSLSNNYLSGTIPKSIQTSGNFLQLGLGFNRFTGTLINDFNVNPESTELEFAVNRLSGQVPSTFIDQQFVDVLSGNLFQCGELPMNDPNLQEYLCGSQQLNLALNIYLGFLAAGVLGMLLFGLALSRYNRTTAISDTESGLPNVDDDSLKANATINVNPVSSTTLADVATSSANITKRLTISELYSNCLQRTSLWLDCRELNRQSFATAIFLYTVQAAAWIAWVLLGLCLVVLIPAYCIMKQTATISTHTFQDGWLPTVCFMRGITPTAIVESVVVLAGVLVTIYFFQVVSKLMEVVNSILSSSDAYSQSSGEESSKSAEPFRFTYLFRGSSAIGDSTNSINSTLFQSPMHSADLLMNHQSRHIPRIIQEPAVSRPPIVSDDNPISLTESKCDSTDAPSVKEDPINQTLERTDTAIQSISQYSSVKLRSQNSVLKLLGNLEGSTLHSSWAAGHSDDSRPRTLPMYSKMYWYGVAVMSSVHIFNSLMTITLNAGYVAVLLGGKLSSGQLFWLQLFLGLYKVVWKVTIVPALVGTMTTSSRAIQIANQVVMDVFNFIASPVIATVLTDSACLVNLFQAQAPVTTTYSVNEHYYETCPTVQSNGTLHAECSSIDSILRVSISLKPNWSYSYQCSSMIFVNYVPVLFYTFLLSGIVLPLFQYGLMLFSPQTIRAIVPSWFQRMFMADTIYWPNLTNVENSSTGTGKHFQRRHIFNIGASIANVILHFAVLMTFGLAAPVLAVAITISLTSFAVQWRLVVGRYFRECPLPMREMMLRVEKATAGLCYGMCQGLSTLVIVVSTFWGLISFDMIADEYGDKMGMVSVIVIAAVTALPFYIAFYYTAFSNFFQTQAVKALHYVERQSSAILPQNSAVELRTNVGQLTSNSERTTSMRATEGDERFQQQQRTAVFEPEEYLRSSFGMPSWNGLL